MHLLEVLAAALLQSLGGCDTVLACSVTLHSANTAGLVQFDSTAYLKCEYLALR